MKKRIIETSKKPPCPECGGRMTLRERKVDGAQFWGCSNYPDCKGTMDIDGEEDEDFQGFFGMSMSDWKND